MFIRERDENMKRIAIITGASSGFGKEFAIQLDKKFSCIDEYWLIARNTEKLQKVSEKLSHKCKILSLDLTREESVHEIVKAVVKEHAFVKMLINSAGFGKIGTVRSMDDSNISDMIKVNCTALTLLTKRLIPYMDDNSRIINISSCAAFLPQPEFAVYAASKSYVLSFTRALNAELKRKDVFATAVCPGPSETNFFNIAEEGGETPWYKKYFMAPPEKIVALAIIDSINMQEVSVYGFAMNAFRMASKFVPHGLILKFW